MAKQYTYDPRKYQAGGPTPPGPGEPGYQGEIRQGASKWDNIKSDIRSFIKYPVKSIRTMNEIGYLPYNFDKGVEGGHISSNPLDFGVGMLNIPGAALKGAESFSKGNYGNSLLNFASILPIAKPLKAAGFSPAAAKGLSKATNKGLKANTTASVYNTGGTTDPNKSAPMVAPMSSDMLRNMSILYPEMAQDFSNMSFNELQDLYKTIQQGTKNEENRIKDFQQFFLNKGSDYVDASNEEAGKYGVTYSAQQGANPRISGGTQYQGEDGNINVQIPAAQYYTDMYNQMKPKTLDWIAGPSGGNPI